MQVRSKEIRKMWKRKKEAYKARLRAQATPETARAVRSTGRTRKGEG